jgi:ribosomal protein S18 acetylase RimI-like enzyme
MDDLRLRPIREDEFGPWLESVTLDYALETARNKKISHAAALEEARASMERILPKGMATPLHTFELAEQDGVEGRIGFLWYTRERHSDHEIVWLFDVVVDEPHRGRGFGRRLMELLEERTRAAGLGRIALNVYADNARARSLYESLGYQEIARQLYKDLDGPN